MTKMLRKESFVGAGGRERESERVRRKRKRRFKASEKTGEVGRKILLNQIKLLSLPTP